LVQAVAVRDNQQEACIGITVSQWDRENSTTIRKLFKENQTSLNQGVDPMGDAGLGCLKEFLGSYLQGAALGKLEATTSIE